MTRSIVGFFYFALVFGCQAQQGLPAGQLANAGPPPARAASISVNIGGSGLTIPTNFVGLSGEVGDFTAGFYQGNSGQWTSNGTTGNAASYISVINLLGPNGVFRLGGGSSDAVTAPTITSGMASNLDTFLSALGNGWTLIYGLDLIANDTVTAATTAINLAAAVGVSNVVLQFGNEPSINGFTAAAYTTRWNSYYTAVTGVVSSPKVAAVDDIINIGWGVVPTVIAGLTPGLSGMSFVSQHWYSFCNGTWSGSVPSIMISSIYQNRYGAGIFGGANAGAGFLSNQGKTGAITQRMSETNTICDRGQAGMSDRLMASTWVLDMALVLASNGWAGINLHSVWWGGSTGVYNVTAVQPDLNFAPTPVFYGMLLFSKIEGEQIVPSAVGGNANVAAIATKGANGNANIIAVNNDVTNASSVTVDQSSAWTTATVLQIKGGVGQGCADPSPTIGGQAIGESGVWSGAPFTIRKGTAVALGPCESVLISVQP